MLGGTGNEGVSVTVLRLAGSKKVHFFHPIAGFEFFFELTWNVFSLPASQLRDGPSPDCPIPHPAAEPRKSRAEREGGRLSNTEFGVTTPGPSWPRR